MLLLPNLWLIYHIYISGYTAIGPNPVQGASFVYLAQVGLLAEFKMYRNILYAVYATLILISIGIIKYYPKKQEMKKDMTTSQSLNSSLLPINDIIVAMLVTTFAYAIAAMLLDIVVFVK